LWVVGAFMPYNLNSARAGEYVRSENEMLNVLVIYIMLIVELARK
jgi:hypothetical protein